MQWFKRISSWRLWVALAFVATALNIALIPRRFGEFLVEYSGPVGWVAMNITREGLWAALAVAAVLYIVWMEVRPLVLGWWRREPRPAKDNPAVTYAVFFGGTHNHMQISEALPPSAPLPREAQVADQPPSPSFVRFRPREMVLEDSSNVTSVTDSGAGDFTFTFGIPFNPRTLAVHAVPPTPSTFRADASDTGTSVRIVFDGEEPDVVALRFDDT